MSGIEVLSLLGKVLIASANGLVDDRLGIQDVQQPVRGLVHPLEKFEREAAHGRRGRFESGLVRLVHAEGSVHEQGIWLIPRDHDDVQGSLSEGGAPEARGRHASRLPEGFARAEAIQKEGAELKLSRHEALL